MTTIAIVSGSSTAKPGDWQDAGAKFEVIGGGGGGTSNNTTNQSTGGGGGAYASGTSLTTVGGTFFHQIGLGGNSLAAGGDTGNSGQDTWIRVDSTNAAPVTTAQGVLAKAGVGGTGGAAAGGAGGTAAASIGNSTKNNGGRGGGNSNTQSSGGGGGGAGSATGAGQQGGDDGGASTTSFGGTGGGGAGGASSTAGGNIPATGANVDGTNGGNGGAGTGGGTHGTGSTTTANATAGTAGTAGTGGGGGGGGGFNGTATGNSGNGGNGATGTNLDGSHGSGGGGGAAGGGNGTGGTTMPTAGNGGLYGGGGAGGGETGSAGNSASGAGAQGIVFITYTPTGGFIFTYFNGVDSSPDTYPRPGSNRIARAASLMRGDEGIQARFVRFIPNDWDTHPFQPSHPRPEQRYAAMAQKDDGIQFPFIRFLPNDWDTHPFQPPHPRPEQRYSAVVQRHEGIESPFARFFPSGWEIAPFQPPVARWIAGGPGSPGPFMLGDQGTEAQFIRFLPYGWELPPPQPRHPRPEAAGAMMPSEPGIEAQFVPPSTGVVWGWETQALLRPKKPIYALSTPPLEQTSAEFNFVTWINYGWEIPSPQPPAYPSRRQKYAGVKGTSQFPIWSTWINYGWEIPSFQPPHPRPERAGAIATSEPGIEAKYVFVSSTPAIWAWDIAAPHVRYRRLNDPDTGDQGTEAQFARWINAGWEIAPPQPPAYPTAKQRYAGIKGRSQFPIWSTWVNYGWDIPSPQPPHPRPERNGAWMLGDQGTEAKYVFVPATPVTMTWDIQQPHLRRPPTNRAIALDGISAFASFTFQPYGWELPPFQPPHPRPEKTGAWMLGDSGIEAPYIFVAPPAQPSHGWEIQPFQPPALAGRLDRFAGIVHGHDGIEFPLIKFFPYGWEIAPHQPQHPRPERAGSIMVGDQGTQYIFIAPPFVTDAWEVQTWQPPHRRPERAGAIMRGDDGIQASFIRWINAGWEIPSFQPPHRAPELKGASIFRGDDGIEAQFIRWFNMGWEIPPYQPPHPRPERAGSIMVGHQGTDAVYVFVPPPVLARFDPNYLTYGQRRIQSTVLPGRLFGSYPPPRKTVTKPTD